MKNFRNMNSAKTVVRVLNSYKANDFKKMAEKNKERFFDISKDFQKGLDNPARLDYFKEEFFKKTEPKSLEKHFYEMRAEFLKDFKETMSNLSLEAYKNGEFVSEMIRALKGFKDRTVPESLMSGPEEKLEYRDSHIIDFNFGKSIYGASSLRSLFDFSKPFSDYTWLVEFQDLSNEKDRDFVKRFRDIFYSSLERFVGRAQTIFSMLLRVNSNGNVLLEGHGCILDDYVARAGLKGIDDWKFNDGNGFLSEIRLPKDVEFLGLKNNTMHIIQLKLVLEKYSTNSLIGLALEEASENILRDGSSIAPASLPFLISSYLSLLSVCKGRCPIMNGKDILFDVGIDPKVETGNIVNSFKVYVSKLGSLNKMRFYEKCFGRDGLDSLIAYQNTVE